MNLPFMETLMPRYLRRLLLSATALILFSAHLLPNQQPARAQQSRLPSISYRLSLSRPVSHLFAVKIEIELPNDLREQPIQFQMAKWSPGRYAVFDFAKNGQEFTASAGSCPAGNCDLAARPVIRIDDQTWSVAPQGAATLT